MKKSSTQTLWLASAWGALVLAIYLLVSALYAYAHTLGLSDYFGGQIAGVIAWGSLCLLASMYGFRKLYRPRGKP